MDFPELYYLMQSVYPRTARRYISGLVVGCCASVFAMLALALPTAAKAQQPTPVLLDAMTTELNRAFTSLGRQGSGKQDGDKQLPPYFLSYSASDASFVSIRAQYGALVDSTQSRVRVAVEPLEGWQPRFSAGLDAWKAFCAEHPVHAGGRRYSRDELHERR